MQKERRITKLKKAIEDIEDKQFSVIHNSFDQKNQKNPGFTRMSFYNPEQKRDISDIYSPLSNRIVKEEGIYQNFNKEAPFPYNFVIHPSMNKKNK